MIPDRIRELEAMCLKWRNIALGAVCIAVWLGVLLASTYHPEVNSCYLPLH